MNANARDDLRAEFKAFLEESGISQNKASESMKESASTISMWLADKYPGNNDKLDESVKRFLKRQKNRRILKKAPIIKTQNFRWGKKVIANTHESKFIGLITGPAGSGKTTLAKSYVDENPQTALYILANEMYTKKIILQELAEGLGIKVIPNTNALARQIAGALLDGDYVVIVDQADYLKDPILELLRHIVMDQGHAGLVLMGLTRLIYKLDNVQGDHEQITSRIGIAFEVKKMTPDEAESILQSLWPTVTKDVVKEAIELVGASFRVLANLIENIQRFLMNNDLTVPDLEVVSHAGRDLYKHRQFRK